MDRRVITLVLVILLCASPSWARMGSMMGMWGGGDGEAITISYIGAAHNEVYTTSVDASISVVSGVQDGDLLLVAHNNDTYTATQSTPSGWEKLDETTGGSNFHGAVYYRVASSEPASYTFSVSMADRHAITMVAFRKSGGTWDVGTYNITDPTTTGTSITATSINGVANGFLYASFFNDGGQAVTTPPSSMTVGYDSYTPTSSGCSVATYYESTSATSYSKSVSWGTEEQRSAIQIIVRAL